MPSPAPCPPGAGSPGGETKNYFLPRKRLSGKMRLRDVDPKYGLVVEASRSTRVAEMDEETMSESEYEEIEVEFSYRKNRKVFRDVLPLSHFMLLYRDARSMVKRGKNYTHASSDGLQEGFDILHFIEELLKVEREKTGPMYG